MAIERDLRGYGRTRPDIVWPNGARVAVSLVVNFEEGAELAIEQGDGETERYGEIQSTLPAGVRDIVQEQVFDYGMVKNAEEIRRLRRATGITVKAHESFRAAIKPGNTDEDLTRVSLARMIAEGADGIHFINVGCGAKTSFAAHSPFPTGHTMEALAVYAFATGSYSYTWLLGKSG